MTQNKPEPPEDKPMGIYLSLNSALSVANWLAPTDVAAMTLARRIALALDTAFDMGDLKEATPLAAKYLSVLQQLHLTVETRSAGKQGEFDRVYDINVKSIFHMAHAVVPLMRQNKGGVILNVGSTAGIRPRPGLTWYNGSKAAVNIISKSMAVELGPDKIRVNAICPVMGETGMFTQFMGMPDTPENRAKFLGSIPLGRFSLPSDVAAAALFLASPEAEFFTGVELPVDGGRTV